MLIDERLKRRSLYELGREATSNGGFPPRVAGSGVHSVPHGIGFHPVDALRFFSQTGDRETLKTQLYLLAVQRGMDVGSSLWASTFAPFGAVMCNKISLVARRERIKNYHGIDMDNLDCEMAYGASNFFAFSSILERVDVQEGDRFLDLGSGCGRAVLAAAILQGHRLKNVSFPLSTPHTAPFLSLAPFLAIRNR